MTNATRARGPYAKSAEVRQRILEAGIAVFGSAGFYGTTMKDVAERAGISQMGLAHHFASKSELLDAVLELRDQRSNRLYSAHHPTSAPMDALHGFLAVVADNQRQRGLVELHTIVAGEAASATHPAHDRHRARLLVFREHLTWAFAELRRDGHLRSPLTPAQLAQALIALSDGLQVQWLFEPDSVDMTETIRAFLQDAVSISI